MAQQIGESDQQKKWRPLSLSLLTHGVLLASLLWVLQPAGAGGNGQPERRVEVVLTVDDSDSTEYLTETDAASSARTENDLSDDPRTSVARQDPPPAVMPEFEDLAGADVPADVTLLDVREMTTPPAATGLNSEFELSAEDLKMIAEDQRLLRARQPVGKPASLRVFGSGQLEGRRFVFVIDRSQSMGSAGLGVIDRARTELTRAIDQLKSNHSFQIVAYHDRTVTIERRQLLPATPYNKSQVPRFIGNLVAFGATSHENGLTAALVFQPDIIVLLTDGGLPSLNGGQLKLIRMMAKQHTQIHCIQFGSGPLQSETGFMTRLAKQNNGSFKYIDVNKW